MRLTTLLLAITGSLLIATHPVHPASLEPTDADVRSEPAAQQPPERSIVGTLDQVDDSTSEIVVKNASGKQRFILESDATIRQGSKTIKAADLAAHKGERVKVRYREASGERHAEWIVVASPSHKIKKS